MGLETLAMDFFANDLEKVESEVTNLYNQSKLLEYTLFSILHRSSLFGQICWKKQNKGLINRISRSCAAMNHLLCKLKELQNDAVRRSNCNSNIYELVVIWHQFVLSLKRTIKDLEHQPGRRKNIQFRQLHD
jgi:hypothetical protein